MKQWLHKFGGGSGLHPNMMKSAIYLARCDEEIKKDSVEKLGVQEGELPVRYLGVPLTSYRLTEDCQVLIEKITCKIIHGPA